MSLLIAYSFNCSIGSKKRFNSLVVVLSFTILFEKLLCLIQTTLRQFCWNNSSQNLSRSQLGIAMIMNWIFFCCLFEICMHGIDVHIVCFFVDIDCYVVAERSEGEKERRRKWKEAKKTKKVMRTHIESLIAAVINDGDHDWRDASDCD